MSLISEVGTDIHKFHSAKAFTNWLHLCPNEKITGGKVISRRTKRGTNPLSQALKSAANAIGNLKSSSHLVLFFKKIAYKKGRKEAITATANKLAVISYNMLTKYESYKPYVRDQETERLKGIKNVNRLLKKHGLAVQDVNFQH